MAKARRTRKLDVDVTVVAVDSSYEPVTAAGRKYRDRNVYPYLEKKRFAVRKFQGNLARRTYVAPALLEPGVEYITGVGHGLGDLYTGDYGDPIFHVGGYDRREVNPKIAHFLSCQTAAKLGPDFVRNGCRAYFGYDVNFAFTWKESEVFFACDSEIDRAFADGLTAGKVYAGSGGDSRCTSKPCSGKESSIRRRRCRRTSSTCAPRQMARHGEIQRPSSRRARCLHGCGRGQPSEPRPRRGR